MSSPLRTNPKINEREALRLEGITTCVGFSEVLDFALEKNLPHYDHFIVVTSQEDVATHQVCFKYGVTCAKTDLFYLHNRPFNKGAAINAGFNYFRYHGWRHHLDVDIVVPNNFRRILFSPMTHIDPHFLYGMDRVDVKTKRELDSAHGRTQHRSRLVIDIPGSGVVRERVVYPMDGYIPIGFSQLWHATQQREYPNSLGSAAHDDSMFAMTWPRQHRALLPQFICLHMQPPTPKGGFKNGAWEGPNWNGRKSTKFR